MVEVAVNGDVLKWARERREFSVSEIAGNLKWETDKLLAFESGDKKPKLGELKKLAKQYDMAFASLLVSRPPTYNEILPEDFRTFAGKKPRNSVKLRRVIEEVYEAMDFLYDISDEMKDYFPDMASFPKISIEDNIEKIAGEERNRIGPTIEDHLQQEKPRDVFYLFRTAIEKQGVFVYVANMGDATDIGFEGYCRGMALLDEQGIPFVVVNSAEPQYEARLFTLIHEYAHILLRKDGLSDQNPKNETEKFCNQFAADFLLPRALFKEEVRNITGDGEIKERHLSRIAKRFKVSKSVVALHLQTCGLVTDDHLYQNLIEKIYEPLKQKEGGGGQARHEEKKVNRFGVRFLNLVYKAYEKNIFNEMDVYELTGIKPKYMDAVAREIGERQNKYEPLYP